MEGFFMKICIDLFLRHEVLAAAWGILIVELGVQFKAAGFVGSTVAALRIVAPCMWDLSSLTRGDETSTLPEQEG